MHVDGYPAANFVIVVVLFALQFVDDAMQSDF